MDEGNSIWDSYWHLWDWWSYVGDFVGGVIGKVGGGVAGGVGEGVSDATGSALTGLFKGSKWIPVVAVGVVVWWIFRPHSRSF